MVDICCSIVVFKPNRERLLKNIKSVMNQVRQIVIVNNDTNEREFLYSLAKEYEKIVLINNDENLGIAYALNKAIEYAEKLEFEWIITLDQDSVVHPSAVKKMMAFANPNIAIISPKIQDQNKTINASFEEEVENVNWAISSSSITNIKVWKEINGFDNQMFIDLVDFDFCVRARNIGYQIIRVNNVILDHQLGDGREHNLFRKKIYVSHHSPRRHYYMARNAIYLNKKDIMKDSEVILRICKLFFKAICFEDEKISNSVALIKGIKDGLKMKVILNNTYERVNLK